MKNQKTLLLENRTRESRNPEWVNVLMNLVEEAKKEIKKENEANGKI